MSPVLKRPLRRTIPAPPAISEFMQMVLDAAVEALPPILDAFDDWTYPKGDLFQWIDVLNRCDSLLESVCTKYELKTQVQRLCFTESDRRLTASILRFSSFLLDHCANRSLYASANNINDLLNTTDMDVLEQVMRISLRLAQRASHQRNGKSQFALSHEKLWKLASSLQHFCRDRGTTMISMVDLIGPNRQIENDWLNICFPYFISTVEADNHRPTEVHVPPVPSLGSSDSGSLSPAPRQSGSDQLSEVPCSPQLKDCSKTPKGTTEGPALISLSHVDLANKSIEENFCKVLSSSYIPETYHFELMLRIRFVTSIGDPEKCYRLVNIRILALATSAYIMTEPVMQARLFSLESNVVSQLAQLIHPDRQICLSVSSSSLNALEAIAHHRPRLGDVLSVLGASVNHGILMQTLRTTLSSLQRTKSLQVTDMLDALLSLIQYLSTTNVAGSMLCSAGLVQLLVQMIQNCQEGALRLLVKALNLLDHLIYGFPQAFQTFCEARGVSILVDRIAREVRHNLENSPNFLTKSQTSNVDYAMTHERFSLLKTMLKFVVHMMQTSGTADGLRNLIESPLLDCMQRVYRNVETFGSSIFASTTNIMATFIHNEPSTYQILHEASLPETFLSSISQSILPASDVLTAIPNAFGALCLNTLGLASFNQANPIPSLMKIFLSTKHCEVMRDSDLAGLLGSSMDELVRHHPSLGPTVLTQVLHVLEHISTLGEGHVGGKTAAGFLSCEDGVITSDIKDDSRYFQDEDNVTRPVVMLYMDVSARFLEGFLQNPNHAKTFVSQGGVEFLLGFYSSSALPYDFAKSHAALSLSHVLRLTCESNANLLVDTIFNSVKQSLVDLENFSHASGNESFFQPYLAGTKSASDGRELIQRLSRLQSLVVLLSDIYAAPMVSHTRNATSFYQTFSTQGSHAQILVSLGAFHRSIIWQDILLSDALPVAWVAATQPDDETTKNSKDVADLSPSALTPEQLNSNEFRDLKMVRFFLCQIPPCIVPFFQGLAKMLFSSRRVVDPQAKVSALEVARLISQVLVDHLKWSAVHRAQKGPRQSYNLVILSVIQMLFRDERNQGVLMTSLLIGFEEGLVQIVEILLCTWSEMSNLPDESAVLQASEISMKNKTESETARLYGIIHLVLHLLERFTSSKVFSEAPQTMALDSKGRNRDKPGYFEPGTFLSHIRALILPSIFQLWTSAEIKKVSPSIVRNLVTVLGSCVIVIKHDDNSRSSVPDHDASIESIENQSAESSIGVNERRNSDEPVPISAFESTSAPTVVDTVPRAMSDEKILPPTLPIILSQAIEQSINLLCIFGEDVVFEFVDLITALVTLPDIPQSWPASTISVILEALRSITDVSKMRNVSIDKYTAIAHFMAILTNHDKWFSLCRTTLLQVYNDLLHLADFLKTQDDSMSDYNTAAAYTLAICDSILTQDLRFKPTLTKDDTSTECGDDQNSLVTIDDRMVQSTFRVLSAIVPQLRDHVALIITMRSLAHLTRRPPLASLFLSSGLLSSLLASIRVIVKSYDDNVRITFLLILRHLVETPKVLHGIFESELRQWFDLKSQDVEVSTYVKQNVHLALRSPDLFITVTKDICCLPESHYDSPTQKIAINPQSSRSAHDITMSDHNEQGTSDGHLASKPILSQPLETDQSIVFTLLLDLYRCRSRLFATFSSALHKSSFGIDDHYISEDTKIPDHVKHTDYINACWLLQCLTELLASYSICKLDFVRFYQREDLSGEAEARNLSDLVCFLQDFGTVAVPESDGLEAKNRNILDSWAKKCLVALCASTSEVDSANVTLQTRRAFLDCLSKTIKDVSGSSSNVTSRYNLYAAYAELVYRLISSPVVETSQASNSSNINGHKDIARLMLERNFVALLTHTLSDIDLQFPDARRIVGIVLRPLKSLTKLSLRLRDLQGPLLPDAIQSLDADDQASFEDTDRELAPADVEAREETPDLYRNSALGLFGAELLEDDEDEYDSHEDVEMYCSWRYDDMMLMLYDELEYDDDGSETGSAVSDEDLDVEDISSNLNRNVDIILENDEDNSSDSEGSSLSEESASDESDEFEEDSLAAEDMDDLVWQEDAGTPNTGHVTTNVTNALLSGMQETGHNSRRNEGENAMDDEIYGNDELADHEIDSDEEESALLIEEEMDDDDADDDQDVWDWTDPQESAAGSHSVGSNIANRLWASLASNRYRGLNRPDLDPEIQIFRRPRIGAILESSSLRESANTLTNPLLLRLSARDTSSDDTQGNHFSHWVESIEALIGGGAVQLIGDIMRRPSVSHNRVLTSTTNLAAARSSVGSLPAEMEQLLRHTAGSGPTLRSAAQSTDPLAITSFRPMLTMRRYQDETDMLYGSCTSDTLLGIINTLLHEMRPEEHGQGATHAQAATTVHERRPAQTSVDSLGHMPSRGSSGTGTTEAGHREISRTTSPFMAVPVNHAGSGIQTIQIRGGLVDISGLDIDSEFLEALPEDIREEVLTQHIRERQAAARESQPAELLPEFLEALPAEIRAELLHQEALDRHRIQRNPRPPQTGISVSADFESATALSSLDPALRQAILVDQEPELLGRLPQEELNSIQSSRPRNSTSSQIADTQGSSVIPEKDHITKFGIHKGNATQLLEKSGIASLLRLLFQPGPSQRNLLHDVLLNLCANRSNRVEIIGQLLSIVQDSTTDTGSTEKSFSILTRKANALVSSSATARSSKKSSGSVSTLVSSTLLVFQCLQALTYILNWNEQLASFFLTEHELPTGRKLARSRVKGKEHQPPTKYPINHVLSLLDRTSILNNTDILEHVSLLLSTISRPLLLLLKSASPTSGRIDPEMHHHEASNGQTMVIDSAALTTVIPRNRSRPLVTPDIPAENLLLVVNMISANACSGKAFQHTLASIHHLISIEGVKGIISAELVKQGRNFVSRVEVDLETLHTQIKPMTEALDLSHLSVGDFSSGSSNQAKFLRILKTLDYLHGELQSRYPVEVSVQPTADMASLSESLQTDQIWIKLSECLTVIHQKDDMMDIATLLLPLIEALLVVCKNASVNCRKEAQTQHNSAHNVKFESLFLSFTDEHKKILNQMVRNNPGLMSGSFALLINNSKVLEFDNKRNYFNRRVRDRGSQREAFPAINLNVRREAVFLDSYKDLAFKSGNEIKFSKFNIRFIGEEGIDAGGVSREWFQVLARQMFDPNYALFVPVNADRNTYHPNKTSGINPEHLLFFKFVGRIVGKALYDGRLLDCHFSRPIYRTMLSKNVTLKDMETLDLDYFKSLNWMLDNDITDVITESFSVERDDFGEVMTIDLVPNGRHITVTEQNKQEYVARVTEYRLLLSVQEQLGQFMIGFNEIIPAELISIFNEHELELLISGLPDVDPDDWKNNTDYQNYSAGSPQIQWFWRAVRSFDAEERARLLQFCTGSSRIPIEGFANLEGMHGVQKFSIHRDYSLGSRLPQSHTCFNQLDLPEYESYDALRSSLLMAISEGGEGFGFA